MLSFIDLLIVLIVAGFVFFGFFFGFVQTLGNLVGTFVGVYVASRFAADKSGTGRILWFIFIFFLSSRIVGIVFWAVGKLVDLLSLIPFAGLINRTFGAIFGLIEGLIAVGVVLYFAQQFLPPGMLDATLHASSFARYLLAMAGAMQILFPASLRS